MGFHGKEYCHGSFTRELIAMKIGLEALVEKHYSQIIIETDSSLVANAMQGFTDTVQTRRGLILECKNLRTKIWNSALNYIPRNYNICADNLAKLRYATN